MSVLLVGLEAGLARILAARLMSQDDEVRMIVAEGTDPEAWRSLGIHVATGDLADDDFVWRAATGARTLVAGDRPPVSAPEVRRALPGHLARTDVDRVVVVGAGEADELVEGARSSDLAFVVLRSHRRGLLGTRELVSSERLAAAIDAADDLPGEPRLELDLSARAAWEALRLEPPG